MGLSFSFSFAWMALFVVITIWASKGASKGRPGDRPNQRAVSVGKTIVWTLIFVLAASLLPGLLGAGVTAATLHSASRTPEWYARWSYVLSPVGFLFWWLSAGQVLWNNFVSTREVSAGYAGVILVGGQRLRSVHLYEGTHPLPKFVTVLPVNMTQTKSAFITFTDVSKDGIKMTVVGFYLRRIMDPDNYFNSTDPDETLEGIFKAAARDFIRGKTKDELMLPEGKGGLEKTIEDALKEYNASLGRGSVDRSFLDESSISVKIDDLEPPEEVLEAAAKKAAEGDVQDQEMIRLNAFIARFNAFMGANSGLSVEETARMFMLHEKLTSAEEFIVRGLEGMGPVGAVLASEVQRAKNRKKGK